MPRALVALAVYLRRSFGRCTGISFVDSTPLAVCRNQRIKRHKVFAGLAARGKTSMGWFFGFKLHLVVNDQGELLGCYLTAGNVDDRKPVPHLRRHLFTPTPTAIRRLTSRPSLYWADALRRAFVVCRSSVSIALI